MASDNTKRGGLDCRDAVFQELCNCHIWYETKVPLFTVSVKSAQQIHYILQVTRKELLGQMIWDEIYRLYRLFSPNRFVT